MGSSTRDRKRKARDQPESTAALTAAPTAASENHGAAPWRVTVLFLQAVTNEGRSRSKKSSRRRSTSKDQTPAEPLALEVRDTARADEDAPAPAGSRSPRSIPRLLVSLSSRRPFVHPVFVLDAPRPSFLPPRSGPDEPRLFRPSTQVYPGETARELCERVLVRGFDFGRTPEVTWEDVRVPLKDRLDELSGGKSRRINFGSGTTTFTVKIPSGARVATAAKPSPRGEVGAGVDGDGLFDGAADANADRVPGEKAEAIPEVEKTTILGTSRNDTSAPSTSGRDRGSGDTGDGGPSRRSARRPTRASEDAQEPQQPEKQGTRAIPDQPTIDNENGGPSKRTAEEDKPAAEKTSLRVPGPTIDSTSEKARPFQNLSSIYARTASLSNLPVEASGQADKKTVAIPAPAEEEEEFGDLDELAAAGLLAVAAGNMMPNPRKRKAIATTRVTKIEDTSGGSEDDRVDGQRKASNVSPDTQNGGDGYKRGSSWDKQGAPLGDGLLDSIMTARGQEKMNASRRDKGADQSLRGVERQGQTKAITETYGERNLLNYLPYQQQSLHIASLAKEAAAASRAVVQAFAISAQLRRSTVGDIVSRFYNHQPPAVRAGEGERSFQNDPTSAFKRPSRGWCSAVSVPKAAAVAVRGGYSKGNPSRTGGDEAMDPLLRAASVNPGSQANSQALWQWQNEQASLALSNQHHHSWGAFVGASKDERFNLPVSRDAFKKARRKNSMEISKLSSVMEQLRRVVSSIKEPLPAKTRAIVISRAQRILEGICKKAECIPIKERAPLSAAVAEVQAWVQQQLDQRLDLKVDDSEQAVMEGLASLVAAADLAR